MEEIPKDGAVLGPKPAEEWPGQVCIRAGKWYVQTREEYEQARVDFKAFLNGGDSF